MRQIINLRNRIVSDEYGIQLRNSVEYTASKLQAIRSDILNERGLSGRFWEQYLRPSIDNLSQKLASLTPLEQSYFYALYNFITKELYTSKSGDVDYEGRTGSAALWLGPPGTGKTSCALKKMVETFHCEAQTQILLLSYTNRAVDEICKAISSIRPEVDFIRVGSELSCDEAYRHHLIENELSLCTRRSEVAERIARCRIFVGTVASISGKPELFRLKRFDVAIIDEATQILEPQLLGILCARSENGENAVGKFILIGDHKQLPAVVLQNTEQSEIYDEGLRSAGLKNLKDSLFERLYRTLQTSSEDLFPDSASVSAPNHRSFYIGQSQPFRSTDRRPNRSRRLPAIWWNIRRNAYSGYHYSLSESDRINKKRDCQNGYSGTKLHFSRYGRKVSRQRTGCDNLFFLCELSLSTPFPFQPDRGKRIIHRSKTKCRIDKSTQANVHHRGSPIIGTKPDL